jgi:predicted Zn-dependent protease
MAFKPAGFVYVGIRKSDGSIRAASCDDAGWEAQNAELIADWIKRGLAVERLSDADYQARLKTKRHASATADSPSSGVNSNKSEAEGAV